MVTVYAFPPVPIVAHSPFFDRSVVNVSRSFFTGRRFVSAAQRKRRGAQLRVSGLAGDRTGPGYMENLRILLAGGENLVRLASRPVGWWQDQLALQKLRQSDPVTFVTGTDPSLSWTNGGTVTWFSAAPISGVAVTDGAGFPALSITGAPANLLIARPGDLVTLFAPFEGTVGTQARVMAAAVTDGAGAAVIRLMSALTGSGRVSIGLAETAAFEMVSMSEPIQPLSGDWTYDLAFSEVFADEVAGGFVEVDPWR